MKLTATSAILTLSAFATSAALITAQQTADNCVGTISFNSNNQCTAWGIDDFDDDDNNHDDNNDYDDKSDRFDDRRVRFLRDNDDNDHDDDNDDFFDDDTFSGSNACIKLDCGNDSYYKVNRQNQAPVCVPKSASDRNAAIKSA